eukprot:CAMPEP_0196570662 /NCGR_PEP_ID=MMETSP1081-20130531/803_1 /TAXON_ID=36882 /ORGANISM="Pyramimonas amylifera, Strain CCMP720" /LENGTH=331 /DNA_ID=CAMNT_0041887221 /DNA_START=224 /DNA_END=1219 /DNA_ORIENTATION=+
MGKKWCLSSTENDEVPISSLEKEEVEVADSSNGGKPLYGFSAVLSTVGLVETAYLTFLKLTTSAPAFCSTNGGCGSVLTSEYSEVLGVPLPALGMLAYGTILGLSVKGALDAKESAPDTVAPALLGCATVAATTSAYLMATLALKMEGVSCAYCYTSAALSALIFASTLPAWKPKDIASGAGVALTVALSLAVGFGDLTPTIYSSQPAEAQASESRDINLPFKQPAVDTFSTRRYVALAKHLKSSGAQMYGAFWCSHCLDQKLLFGQEAMTDFPYVECFPSGYKTGTKMEPVCKAADLEGFPTWVINGQKFEGEQTFDVLAEASGFSLRGD